MTLTVGSQAAEVKSPNGNVVVNFSIDVQGRPTYEMSYKGQPVVKPSHLGLELAKDKHASRGFNETNLLDGFTLKSEQQSTFDETWQPVWGETRDIRNHYNEYAAVLLQQKEQREMVIRFRVYDDGIGFRYEFEEPELLPHPGGENGICHDGRPHGMVAARRLRLAGAGDTGDQVIGDTRPA